MILARNRDTVVGVTLIVVGLLACYFALGVPRGPAMRTLPSNFFPILCAAGIALGGLALLVKGIRGGAEAQPILVDRRMLAMTALMAVYFFGFRYIDFRVGTWAYSLLALLLMGTRSAWQLTLIPLITAATLYLIFRHGFVILVPTWI